jgi:hypothetical protein
MHVNKRKYNIAVKQTYSNEPLLLHSQLFISFLVVYAKIYANI